MKPTVQTIQVFDPALCCSTGVCGPEVDPKLVQFAADLDWIKSMGVLVQRHNLAQNPAAYVQQPSVLAVLMEKGEAALPLVLINGRPAVMGRYPGRKELAEFLHLQVEAANETVKPSSCCCGGMC